MIFQLVYLYINPFGHDLNYLKGISFLVIFAVISMAIMSLFKPWMLSVDVSDNVISQITELGGQVVIDINHLDFERTVHNNDGLELVTTDGNILLLHSHLFKESDLLRLADYIQLTSYSNGR